MGLYTIENGYKKDKPKALYLTFLTIIALVGGLAVLPNSENISKSPDNTSSVTALNKITPPAKLSTTLPWPDYGQSAYGRANTDLLVTSKEQSTAAPIASLAKVITALAVLKKKPLNPGEQGPLITFTEKDVALYNNYLAKNGSVVFVEPGQKISQYQAMQAMLMPSANNIADSLVIWAFGSLDVYNSYANEMVAELGLTHTTVADASGFSPSTTGTSQELVKIGILYMKNPVLREIALLEEADIPLAGKIKNYNSVANKDGLMGIKVGFTDEAGRCFMLASLHGSGSSKDDVSVTVVLGAEKLDIAVKDAEKIIKTGDNSAVKAASIR